MYPGRNVPLVLASSETIAPSGRSAPIARAIEVSRQLAGWAFRSRHVADRGINTGAERIRERLQRSRRVVAATRQQRHVAALRNEVTRLARIREEGDR